MANKFLDIADKLATGVTAYNTLIGGSKVSGAVDAVVNGRKTLKKIGHAAVKGLRKAEIDRQYREEHPEPTPEPTYGVDEWRKAKKAAGGSRSGAIKHIAKNAWGGVKKTGRAVEGVGRGAWHIVSGKTLKEMKEPSTKELWNDTKSLFKLYREGDTKRRERERAKYSARTDAIEKSQRDLETLHAQRKRTDAALADYLRSSSTPRYTPEQLAKKYPLKWDDGDNSTPPKAPQGNAPAPKGKTAKAPRRESEAQVRRSIAKGTQNSISLAKKVEKYVGYTGEDFNTVYHRLATNPSLTSRIDKYLAGRNKTKQARQKSGNKKIASRTRVRLYGNGGALS